VATLTLGDLICSKLLANSDRWNDDGVFNRDLIDLAHLPLTPGLWRRALAKAEDACGDAIRIDLGKALERLQQREGFAGALPGGAGDRGPTGGTVAAIAQPATVGRRRCAGRSRPTWRRWMKRRCAAPAARSWIAAAGRGDQRLAAADGRAAPRRRWAHRGPAGRAASRAERGKEAVVTG